MIDAVFVNLLLQEIVDMKESKMKRIVYIAVTLFGFVSVMNGSLWAMQEKVTSTVRDVIIKTSDGAYFVLPGAYVKHIQWVADACMNDEMLGSKGNELLVPLTGSQFALIRKLVKKVIKETSFTLENETFNSMSLEQLAEVIKISKTLHIEVVYEYATRQFVEKLKGALDDFVATKDWINKVGFEEDILVDLGELIVRDEDRRVVRSSLYEDLIGLDAYDRWAAVGQNYKARFNGTGDSLITWGAWMGGLSCTVWDTETATKIGSITSVTCRLDDILFAENSLVGHSGEELIVYDLLRPKKRGTSVLETRFTAPKIWGIAKSSDNTKIVAGIGEMLMVRDMILKNNRVLDAGSAPSEPLGLGEHLLVTPDNSMVIECRSTGLIRFWSLDAGILREMNEHHAPITMVRCTSDQKLLTGSANGVLIKWNINPTMGGEIEKRWDTKKGILCADETGTSVALADADQGGAILSLVEGTTPELLKCPSTFITGCYHPNEPTLATLTSDEEVCLWNTQSRELLTRLPIGPNAGLLEFSPNGDVLVAGKKDGFVRLLHYTDREIQAFLEGGNITLEQALLLLAYVQKHGNDLFAQKQFASLINTFPKKIIRTLFLRGIDVHKKDKEGFTPLHYAAMNGQDRVVEVLIDMGAPIDGKGGKLGGTPLHDAVARGHESVVRILLDHQANVNARADNGVTPICCISCGACRNVCAMVELLVAHGAHLEIDGVCLMAYAALFGDKEVILELLDRGLSVHDATAKGTTALHNAAGQGYKEVVGVLLDRGALVTAQTKGGLTPLHYAVDKSKGMDALNQDRLEIVQLLLDNGADYTSRTSKGLKAIHVAARCGFTEMVQFLHKKGAKLTSKTDDGMTALHFASLGGHSDLVELLVQANISVDEKASKDRTSLHVAAGQGHVNVVELLLKHNARIDAVDSDGRTPLHYASGNGHLPVVELLLKYNASIDAAGSEGGTSLHVAADRGHVTVVELLLKHNARIDATNSNDATPLMFAIIGGHSDAVRCLLSNGADAARRSKRGLTPLMFAVVMGRTGVASLLLVRAPDLIDNVNEDGWSALHYAVLKGRIECVNLLLSKGANRRLQAKHGITPLHYAALSDYLEIMDLLGVESLVESSECAGPLLSAAYCGNVRAVEKLLDMGVSVDSRVSGFIPMLPSSYQNTSVKSYKGEDGVEVMLDEKECQKLDREARLLSNSEGISFEAASQQVVKGLVASMQGMTALHVAVSKGHKEVVELLLRRGADSTALSKEGLSVLAVAEDDDIAQLLLENGADSVLKTTVDGITLLHAAVTKSLKLVKLYRKAGLSINEVDNKGRSVLAYAVEFSDDPAIIRYLLKKGANGELADTSGMTPLYLAAKLGKASFVDLLLEAGVRVDYTNLCTSTLEGHTGPVMSASFSPDGTTLVTASHDSTAKIWDVLTGNCLHTLQGHTGDVNLARFSPDGTTLVTASHDATAKIWDVLTGNCLHILQGHTGPVMSASFSPDGTTLVTASHDATAKIWDVLTGNCLHTLQGHTGDVNLARFSPDGTTLVTASHDATAKIWDVLTGNCLHILQGHTRDVFSARFSPDGTTLVTASDDATAKIWDVLTGNCLHTLQGHTSDVNLARFSPDGTTLVTASWDATAKIWDVLTGNCLHTLRGHTSGVYSASFSPDSTTLVTASPDATAKIWDVLTGNCLHTLQGHTDIVHSPSFSPDGTILVTTSNDKTPMIWDVLTGKCLHTLEGHTGNVWSASFSPDGTTLVTASADRTAKIWDVSLEQFLHGRARLLNRH